MSFTVRLFVRKCIIAKVYPSIEDLQKDVDAWLEEYNVLRTHTGKYCFGKTPMVKHP